MCANNFAQGIRTSCRASPRFSQSPCTCCGSSLHACCAYLKLGLFFNGRGPWSVAQRACDSDASRSLQVSGATLSTEELETLIPGGGPLGSFGESLGFLITFIRRLPGLTSTLVSASAHSLTRSKMDMALLPPSGSSATNGDGFGA